jgi:hypothetical protein
VASIEISASQMLADEVLEDERRAQDAQDGQACAEGGETSPMSIGLDAVAMRDFMTVYVKPAE